MKKSLKEIVSKQVEEIREYASKFTVKDIRDGEWFVQFITYSLSNYAKKVNPQYFKTKYPNVPVEGIVKKRIKLAQKYAAIEGGLSASLYSGSVAATIGSLGGASPITTSAAITSFVVDMLYTTKLQLNLAYDLSVLYNKPANIEDPEDVIDLIRIAFGVKASEKLTSAVSKIAPETVRVGIKATIHTTKLAWLKSLPVVGKFLLQRNIIKFAIPVVCIPLSTGMNYYFTGKIAKSAKNIYKQRAIIAERSKDIINNVSSDYLLLIEIMWIVINADKKTTDDEINFMNEITKLVELTEDEETVSQLKEFRERIEFNTDKIIAKLVNQDKETQEYLFEAACTTAAIDKEINKSEIEILEKIATACNIQFDKKDLKKLI